MGVKEIDHQKIASLMPPQETDLRKLSPEKLEEIIAYKDLYYHWPGKKLRDTAISLRNIRERLNRDYDPKLNKNKKNWETVREESRRFLEDDSVWVWK